MALRDQPYLPLYVHDFLTDEKLIECSASTTGVYIRLMCIMHKSEQYGNILLKQKDKQNAKQNSSTIEIFAEKIAKQMPYSVREVYDALQELIAEKVLILEGDTLTQKRMVKDNDLSLKRASAGKKGGNKSHFAQAKPQAKPQANSEIEYESEVESEYVTEPEKPKKKKKQIHVVLPFDSHNFTSMWDAWKQYKHDEHRFRFASPKSEQASLKQLADMAHGNEQAAIDIIVHSMANGWKGLFPIKNQINNGRDNNLQFGNQRISLAEREQLAREVQAAVNKGTFVPS